MTTPAPAPPAVRSRIGDELTALDVVQMSHAGAGEAPDAWEGRDDDPRVAMMDKDGTIRIARPDSFGRLRVTQAFTHPRGIHADVFTYVQDVFHTLDRRFEVTRLESGADASVYRDPEVQLASAGEAALYIADQYGIQSVERDGRRTTTLGQLYDIIAREGGLTDTSGSGERLVIIDRMTGLGFTELAA